MIRFGSRDGSRNGPRNGAGIDDLVERTLSRARMAREPSIVDKERVLTALRDYMDDPTGAAPHEDGAASGVRQITQEVARPAASQWGQAVLSASGRWVRPWTWVRPSSWVQPSSLLRPWSKAVPSSLTKLTLQKLVWVGAFTGGLGFWLGSQPEPAALVAPAAVTPAAVARAEEASESEPELSTQAFAPVFAPNDTLASSPLLVAPSEPPQPAPTQTTPPAAKPSPVGVAASPTLSLPMSLPLPRPNAPAPEAAPPAVPEPAEVLAPAALAPEPAPLAPEPAAIAPAPAPRAHRPPPSAAPVAAPSAPSGASVSPSAPSAPPPSPGDAGFLEAVRIVQRAQRSLERNAPHTALLLLDDLDARFPAVLLNEERLATRVLAFCAIGASGRARRAAAELELRNPSSIYAARIAQSCAGSGTPSAPRR